jgi:hypothetical protein
MLIQETNNTVVWLRPEPIIAKVATRADSADRLIREHHVVSALDRLGAPVGPPVPGVQPVRHPATGFLVTLWQRFDHDPSLEPPGAAVGESLRDVHDALSACGVQLPSFQVGLERARAALFDDRRAAALSPSDRTFLRASFDDLVANVAQHRFEERALHGEPHDGNRLLTKSGLRWIDFEAACWGPVEWDLAFLPDDARGAFAKIDTDLLAVLQILNSARVATWCWVQYRFPEMRWHAEFHLEVVRRWRRERH